MGITSFLIFHSTLPFFRAIWYGFNVFTYPEEPFRETVFFQIPLLLLFGKVAEGFAAAIADEESTGDNIRNISGILIPDGPVQGQTVDFSFLVADGLLNNPKSKSQTLFQNGKGLLFLTHQGCG